MKALVLTYHSHNIAGVDYATNDHVALACDLRTLTQSGARIVPLARIVEALRSGLEGAHGETWVALTFDDGPSFDYADFVHARFGPQRSFLNVMRDFAREAPGAQAELHATSFVIASPDARSAMESAEDCGYPDMADWLGDAWWKEAAKGGLLAIGNHSWDHVHHAVPRTAIVDPARDDFTRVASYIDADREIRRAADFIRKRSRAPCEYFAYPFGHVNAFLVEDYMPCRAPEHGMRAAFGVDGRAIAPDDSIWNIPRAVCGHHWKSPGELRALLGRAS